MAFDNDELTVEFVAESREIITEIESILVELETSGADGKVDQPTLDAIFRAFHSIKGTAGFLDLVHMVRATHQAESLLDAIRTGEIAVTAPRVTVMLKTVDFVHSTLAELEETGGDLGMQAAAEQLVAEIQSVMREERAPVVLAEEEHPNLVFFGLEDSAPAAPPEPEPEPEAPGPAPPPAEPSLVIAPPAVEEPTKRRGKGASRASIRVDLHKLDELMNLVGELIIAQNMVTRNEDLEGLSLQNFSRASVHLNRITRSLQDLAMSVRMIPLRGTFRKMLRVVRDVSHKQEKQVELVLLGEDTEVDRTVIESINDPLVHLLRNAIDHGVESAEARVAGGKEPVGRITLEARHEAGEVWIVLTDDGKGLDRDTILAKGIEKGLVPQSAQLTDEEVFQLIFNPGFSTAAQVTSISGRGVGMDVVHRNITKLRGRIEVASTPGVGTVFTLRIPLTLAIVEGMLVRVGDQSYTIPLFSIRESIRVTTAHLNTLPNGTEMVRVRDRFIRIIRLHEVHGIVPRETRLDQGLMVIVEAGADTAALFVDDLVGQRQTVVKPIPPYLGHVSGLAGCSIMSTGAISLILDVKTLIQGRRAAA